MNQDEENESEISKEEVEKYLPVNKYTYTVQVDRLFELLKKIKPIIGDFLYWDIIGRIVWNASATAKSIERLIKIDDYFGASSLARKLFECRLLLDYLFQTKDKSKVIARIMTHDIFNNDMNYDKAEALKTVTAIVKGFQEDDNIIEHFKYYLDRGPKHWHWSEKSFTKLIKIVQSETNDSKFDEEILNHKIDLLKFYHRDAHVDLDLSTDYLKDTPDGDVEYISPLEKSERKLLSVIGLSRLVIMDIIQTVENKLVNIKTI